MLDPDQESIVSVPKHGFWFEFIIGGDACGRGKAARARAGRRTVGPGAASQTLSKLCQVFQSREKKASLQVSLSESHFLCRIGSLIEFWICFFLNIFFGDFIFLFFIFFRTECVFFLTDPGHLSYNKVPISVKTIKKAWKINRTFKKQCRILTGLITLL